MITAEEILTKAIECWQTTGWTQGQAIDAKGRRCLIGGIQSAACGLPIGQFTIPERDKAIAAVADVVGPIRLAFQTTGEVCVQWNDTLGRTVEEVIIAAEQARANLKREADK